ncbi:hypothetical protein F5Y03DRAFT_143458 [Xylaria venustula]|nr:hypothetical protein F5Y03DRAFT_143458 [Xylaria venustula]
MAGLGWGPDGDRMETCSHKRRRRLARSPAPRRRGNARASFTHRASPEYGGTQHRHQHQHNHHHHRFRDAARTVPGPPPVPEMPPRPIVVVGLAQVPMARRLSRPHCLPVVPSRPGAIMGVIHPLPSSSSSSHPHPHSHSHPRSPSPAPPSATRVTADLHIGVWGYDVPSVGFGKMLLRHCCLPSQALVASFPGSQAPRLQARPPASL